MTWHLLWEEIERTDNGENYDRPYVVLERAAVPGGWLVRSMGYTADDQPSNGTSITFVPDPLKEVGK